MKVEQRCIINDINGVRVKKMRMHTPGQETLLTVSGEHADLSSAIRHLILTFGLGWSAQTDLCLPFLENNEDFL